MDLLASLNALLPQGQVSLEPADRFAVCRDLSTRGLIQIRAGLAPPQPSAVVWPDSLQQLQQLVIQAPRLGHRLVAFGAGSGVVNGVVGDDKTIVVDLKRFNDLQLDKERQICVAGAGVLGEHLERWLNERGFSLGHFPSSIYCSTVGGWVATRSAGQLSSRYGKIEDMVRWVEGVDGNGQVHRLHRGAADLDALGLVVGSEGSLMLITKAALAVHPLPPCRVLRGAEMPNVANAVEAMRTMMRCGLSPTVVRLYDPLDTTLSGHAGQAAVDTELLGVARGAIGQAGLEQIRVLSERISVPGGAGSAEGILGRLLGRFGVESSFGEAQRSALRRLAILGAGALPRLGGFAGGRLRRCRLIYGFEGGEDQVTAEIQAAMRVVEDTAGKDLGPAAGQHWLERRYAVSYKMSRILDAGLWVDTFEVAARWSRLLDVYRSVRYAVRQHAICLAHFSHAYPDGCSIYFTFVGGGETADEAIANHAAAWNAGLTAARKAEAVLSHHHGVGRLKAQFLEGIEGPGSKELKRDLKDSMDPHGILNPGVLGLGEQKASTYPAPHTEAKGSDSILRGMRSLYGFDFDAHSGLVRVPGTARLAIVARRLGAMSFEIGGRPGSFGRSSVATALADSDPRLVAHLAGVEAEVDGKPLCTALVPRGATGPDSKSFALGRGLSGLEVKHVWLYAREMVRPAVALFENSDSALLLRVGRRLVDLGATAVEVWIKRSKCYLTALYNESDLMAEVWQARLTQAAQTLKTGSADLAQQWLQDTHSVDRQLLSQVYYNIDQSRLLQAMLSWSGQQPERSARLVMAPLGGAVLLLGGPGAEGERLGQDAAVQTGMADLLEQVRQRRSTL